MLPPRNYKLVSEDGRVLKKDNFEPMSFGMRARPTSSPALAVVAGCQLHPPAR